MESCNHCFSYGPLFFHPEESGFRSIPGLGAGRRPQAGQAKEEQSHLSGTSTLLQFLNHYSFHLEHNPRILEIVMIFEGGLRTQHPLPPTGRYASLARLYASVVQARTAATVDHLLPPQQFGLRQARFTSTPIFLVRRLVIAASPHYLLFLDWSQAPALPPFSEAPRPSCYLNKRNNTYLCPRDKYQVLYSPPNKGVRLGCPLSPYFSL